MAKLNGTGGSFFWNAVEIENVKSASIDLSTVAVDATDNDSAGDKEYLVGDRDGTCSVTVNYEPAALSCQEDLIEDFHSGTDRTVIWQPTTGSTFKKYTFSAIITGMSIPAAHDTTVEMTVTFQITGGITVGTQT